MKVGWMPQLIKKSEMDALYEGSSDICGKDGDDDDDEKVVEYIFTTEKDQTGIPNVIEKQKIRISVAQ